MCGNVSLCLPSVFIRFEEARRISFVLEQMDAWRWNRLGRQRGCWGEHTGTHPCSCVLWVSCRISPSVVTQLYAMSVQEEPVTVIQIISLPVSFLSAAWAFTTVDVAIHKDEGNGNTGKVKYKFALFVTQVLLLSSRLFAVSYFTVSYKWWVIGVLSLHISVLATADIIWFCRRVGGCEFLFIFFYCLNWLRDDVSGLIRKAIGDREKELRRMQLFSNVLFVLENLVMILLYYFSQHSNNWYSLPVTVCVCVFSVVYVIMIVALSRWVQRKANAINPQVENNWSSSADVYMWCRKSVVQNVKLKSLESKWTVRYLYIQTVPSLFQALVFRI